MAPADAYGMYEYGYCAPRQPLLQPSAQALARGNAEVGAAAESAGERGKAPRGREGAELGERRLS